MMKNKSLLLLTTGYETSQLTRFETIFNKYFNKLLCKTKSSAKANDITTLFTAKKLAIVFNKLEIYLNEEQVLGSLKIILKSCQSRPPDFLPESAAYLEIYDNLNQNFNDNNLIFSGWMFSSSPAISALEHPVYDISLISCK